MVWVPIGIFCCKIDMKRWENIGASYKRYTDRSRIFQLGESLGKGISCRKLYRDDIPQYGRIRWEKVHPGTSASIRKARKIIRHVPYDELELRSRPRQLAVLRKPMKKGHCAMFQSRPSMFASIVLH